MTFSDWSKKRKNRQVDLQETTPEPQTTAKATARPTQKQTAAPSFEEWTRTQQDKQRQTELRSAWSDKPKSFDEWTRQQRGEEAWRDEEAGYNDFLSRLNQYSKTLSESQGTGYQTAEQAQKYRYDTSKALDELAQQAREYRNFFTANRDRYDEDRANRIFQSLDSGDSYLSGARENANQQEAFWKQFQNEDEYNSWKKWQEYEALRGNLDFAEKSQYKSTANGEGLASRTFYGTSGYDDVLYDAINGDSVAQNRLYTSNDPRRYDYAQISDETKALFNYIYATQGDVAAYEYLDGAVGQRYDGIDAMGYGALQGSGVLSLATGIGGAAAAIGGSEERERYKEAYGSYLADAQSARAQNKAAYTLGNIGGNLALMTALGGATGAAGKAAGGAVAAKAAGLGAGHAATYIAGKTVSQVVSSGLTFMAADAARNSGAYVTGNMSGGDFWKSLGVSGAQGMANGLAGGLIQSGMAYELAKTGNMTNFAEFVRQTVAGTASATASTAVGYGLRDEKPDNAQIATDLATAFAFSMIQGAISTAQTSAANQEAMETAVAEIQRRYSEMSDGWNSMDPEQRYNAAKEIVTETGNLRNALHNRYIAGQQSTVNQLDSALDLIESGMRNYMNGFQAATGAAAASYEGNLLGGANYDTGAAGSSEGTEVAAQMQAAVEQGLSIAQQGAAEGMAQPPADSSAINLPAATVQTGTGSEILARAAQEVANGGSVTNSMAQGILTDPSAVATLEEAAGLQISDDMSQAQARKAVKAAVGVLASRQDGATSSGSEITPEPSRTAQESAQAAQRTAAIMAQDTKAVADFASTMGKAGNTALTGMYNPSARADTYIRGMMDYYNAGKAGQEISEVKSNGALAQEQKEAAYLAGSADAEPILKQEDLNNGEQAAQIRVRQGGQWDRGTDSRGELQGMGGGAGQNPGWHVQAGSADAGAASLTYGQKVSTADLGFTGGLETDELHLVTGGSTEATSAARSLAESRGLEITFFGGGNLSVAKADGGVTSARAAYVDGNHLYVRADHPEFTAEQLTRHEVGHDMLAKGEIDREKVMDQAREMLGEKRYQESIDQYEAAYRKSGLTPGEVQDEIICDSLGGMNVFHDIPEMEDKAQNILDAATVAVNNRKDTQATRGPPDDGVKLSRDMKERNRALQQGEMVNKFRDKVNWKRYYQEIIKDEYNPDYFEDKDETYMNLDGSLITLQMQRNGEWAVTNVEELSIYGNSSTEQGRAKGSPENGTKGIPGERKDDSNRVDLERAGTTGKSGGASGPRGNSQGDGKSGSTDYQTTFDESTEGSRIKTQFSMETPIEETKDLIAVHNVSEQGLLGALELGGLPSPSIAITRADMGHTKYGDISLVFSKDTVDPQLFRSNKVYGSDAWTPTAPKVEYPVDSKKLFSVERDFHKLAGSTDVAGGIFGNSSVLRSMGLDDTSTKSAAELAEAISQTDTGRAAYLADQGKTLEPVKQAKTWDKYGNNTLQKVVDQIGAQRLAEIDANLELGKTMEEALGADADTIRSILRDYYGESGEAFLKKMAVRNKWSAEEINQRRQARIDKAMENNVTNFTIEDVVRHAWQMYEDGGATKGEIDRLATSEALRSAVNDSDVKAWAEGKLEGLLGKPGIYNGKDRYTSSGNSRSFKQLHYEYTLDNIVKAMKDTQEARGEGMWGASGGSLMAVATPEYQSLEEIRADKGRLRTESHEEYTAEKEKLTGEIGEVINRIRKLNKPHSDNSFEEMDIIGSLMMEAAKGKHTTAAIRKVFQDSGYSLSTGIIDSIKLLYQEAAQTATEYFEAKPQRAVGFDEVLAAVVPDNAGAKLTEALEQNGVSVIPYKAGDTADRLSKVNSVENARFSQDLTELDDLRKENKRLREQVDHWKGQLQKTTSENRTVRQKDVDRLAKDLVKSYESTLDTAQVSAELKKLGEFIVRNGDGKNELTWEAVHDSALKIGRDLVESALSKDDSAYKAYTELRKYLRDTKITLGPQYANDIPDFKDFKAQLGGKVRLSIGDKTNVDQVYTELSANWPELFDEGEAMHPTDQVLHIADVLDGLKPIYENPYSYDMSRAAEYAAGDILDGLMGDSVKQAPPTFADKQARKLEDAVARERAKGAEAIAAERQKRSDAVLAEKMAAGREISAQARKAKEAISAERQIRDQKLQALKDHYREIQDRRRERKEDSDARTRLLKIARRLQNKKLPAVNRALLNQYIGDLDTAAKSMTGHTLERLTDLQAWYSDQKDNNPDFIADPHIEKALKRLSQKQISSLSNDEVRDLTDVLLNIENEIRTQRKLIDSQDRRDIYHMGQDVIQDVYNTKGTSVGIGGTLDRLFVTETLSPVRQIRRMTGYVDTDPLYNLTKGLADGQRDMMSYQMRSSKPFDKFSNDKKFRDRFSGKNADRIEVHGTTIQGKDVTVHITPAMRVSLYLHSLNDDNLRHIAYGGITIPNETLYRKNKLEEAYNRGITIRMSPSDVRAIASGMTEQERSFAQAAKKYFNQDSKQALNEVSEKLKGYPVAEVDNYFPINTDSNFTKSEFESLKRDGTIEGMGFLKERVVAKNPIMLRDVNEVVDQAIRMHGKYVGLAIPVRNFTKVWNVSTNDYSEDGPAFLNGSVKSAVAQRWGTAGTKYVDELMKDLQEGTAPKNEWGKALDKVRSKYASAVLTMNLSVAMKQAASYPTAAAVLGWKPLAKAMTKFGKVDLSLIEKYTPLQWYRSKGFSSKELGDMASNKVSLPEGLNWVQGVDLITTRKLWKASEYYVQDYQKGLNPGTDEYYKAVADVYNRVIEETQPNYTVMQRPQLLRSKNALVENLSMFKTQPFQNTGIVYDAVGNYIAKAERAKTGGEKEKAAAKEAKRDLGWAFTSQLGQLAVFAGMNMAWALLRGRKDKYANEDGEITVGSIAAAIGKDMIGGALSGIPGGSDAWELLSSKIYGDKYYGLDAVAVTAIQDSITAITGLGDQIGRIRSSVIKGESVNWNSERLALDKELDSFSKAVGVPFENVVNLFNIALRQTVTRTMGENVGEYTYLKWTVDPEKYPNDYYDTLYKAMEDNQEDYQKIYEDMVKFGFDEDKIRNAMEKRMKDAQGVKKASDLDRRYLNPTQEASWDEAYGVVSGSSLWNKATEDQRDAVEDKLYDYVTQNAAGEKIREKVEEGSVYGLTDSEYMLYLLALSMADQPTESGKLGSYTNAEVEEAIRMIPGLTDEERSYLWTAQGKSDKSNPWG